MSSIPQQGEMSNYSSFFTSVVKLDKEHRDKIFFLVCIPTRTFIGFMFYLLNNSLLLSYVSAIWGISWLLFMVRQRRWETIPGQTPPWWTGLWRITFRFAFSLSLLAFGIIGVLSSNERTTANIAIAICFWIDLFIGIFDKIMSANH
jgi:hypothetical protein